MKNVLKSALGAFLFLVLFTSCDKEDEGSSSASIIGTWTVNSSAVDIKINGQSLVEYLSGLGLSDEEVAEFLLFYTEAFATDIAAGARIEFKADNTYVATADGDTDSGTYELSSDRRSLTVDKGTENEFTFQVGTLTSNSLLLFFEQTEVEAGQSLAVRVDLNLSR